MSIRRLTRRQALGAMAAAGAAVCPLANAARAGSSDPEPGETGAPHAGGSVYRWRGAALGVRASIALFGEDARRGADLRRGWEAELGRLDAIFSLYRHDSALRRLNREGGIDAPPLELVELLSLCRGLHRLTGGAFDPTVQPLWELHARQFPSPPESAGGHGRGDHERACDPPAAAPVAGPGLAARERALRRVGFERVVIEPARIEFERANMGITLNGIAQGYLTDRIAERLLRAGVTNALVDIGEIRVFGRPSGRESWRIDRTEPGEAAPHREAIELTRGAVATSSPAGFRFGGHPRHHHLFDTRTGESASRASTVTVVAPTATLADGLSTAFAMMAPRRVQEIAGAIRGVAAYVEPPRRC